MPKLSMPIGATLVPGGGVVVAGLSVPEKVVRVARVSRSGVVERRADVLAGAEWAHDAEISPHAVGSAVALVYRGKLEGQLQRVVVRLDDTLSAGPRRVFGTTTCATRDAVYWLEKKGVKAELAAGPRDLDLPGMDGDLGLFCDESRAFVTGDAEGVLSAVALSAEGAKTVLPIVGDKDFADEEREHVAEMYHLIMDRDPKQRERSALSHAQLTSMSLLGTASATVSAAGSERDAAAAAGLSGQLIAPTSAAIERDPVPPPPPVFPDGAWSVGALKRSPK